jgi:hypothetical protein
MKTPRHTYQAGAVSGSLIAIIGLIILVIGFGGAAIWAYSQYDAQKTNVNGKIDLAIAKAKKDQGDVDDAKFAERDKEPNRQFVGPDDYGRLTFNYPKTWSVYEATDVTQNGGTYEAYLNPVSVPPISSSQQFGLRVTIEARNYDQIVSSYDS